jgi:hypothetical protein
MTHWLNNSMCKVNETKPILRDEHKIKFSLTISQLKPSISNGKEAG